MLCRCSFSLQYRLYFFHFLPKKNKQANLMLYLYFIAYQEYWIALLHWQLCNTYMNGLYLMPPYTTRITWAQVAQSLKLLIDLCWTWPLCICNFQNYYQHGHLCDKPCFFFFISTSFIGIALWPMNFMLQIEFLFHFFVYLFINFKCFTKSW